MAIDLKVLSKQQLKNMLGNARDRDREDIVVEVLRELTERGLGKRDDYRALRWNQDTVKTALEPFFEVARSVAGNLRTPYTEAGGFKIGRSKDDPDRMWVDSYSAIKTGALNAVFVCYVKQPGDDPEFQLLVNGALEGRFDALDLDSALARWRELAARA